MYADSDETITSMGPLLDVTAYIIVTLFKLTSGFCYNYNAGRRYVQVSTDSIGYLRVSSGAYRYPLVT